MHHLAYWTEQYDADTALYRDQGFGAVIEGRVAIEGTSGIRYSYLEPGYEDDTLVEIVEVTDVSRELNRLVLNASVGWDGSDPVRTM